MVASFGVLLATFCMCVDMLLWQLDVLLSIATCCSFCVVVNFVCVLLWCTFCMCVLLWQLDGTFLCVAMATSVLFFVLVCYGCSNFVVVYFLYVLLWQLHSVLLCVLLWQLMVYFLYVLQQVGALSVCVTKATWYIFCMCVAMTT